MKTNYVLIDYENVQPEAMAGLCEDHFKVLVFVGENQSKVTFEVASALQQMGDLAEYVKITGNGKNALDFHIAYYLGQLALKAPDAFFHIVSKDTGFDPLIQHLKAHKILACRSIDVSEIPILKTAAPKTQADKISLVIEDLKRRKASKPRAVKIMPTGLVNWLRISGQNPIQSKFFPYRCDILHVDARELGYIFIGYPSQKLSEGPHRVSKR